MSGNAFFGLAVLSTLGLSVAVLGAEGTGEDGLAA